MAKSLGDLYVSLSLKAEQYTKALQRAGSGLSAFAGQAKAVTQQMAVGMTARLTKIADSLGAYAAKAKDVAEKVGGFFTAAAASVGVLVAAASQTNARVGAEVERMQATFGLLASEVATALLPALERTRLVVAGLVAEWRALSPETKATVSSLAGFATGAALVAAGAGKLLSLVQGVAAVAAGLAGLALPLLAVGAAVAGVALLAGSLYGAFADSSKGIGDNLTDLWNWVVDLGRRLTSTLGGWVDSLRAMVAAGVKVLLNNVAGVANAIGRTLGPLARGLGLEGIASAYEDMAAVRGDALYARLAQGADTLAAKAAEGAAYLSNGAKEIGGAVGESVSYGLRKSTAGARRLGNDIAKGLNLDGLVGKVQGLLSGQTGRSVAVRGKAPEFDFGKTGGATISDMMSAGNIRAFATGRDPIMLARQKMLEDQAKKEREDAKKASDELSKARQDAVNSLVSRGLGALGDLGSMIQNAAQAAAAGPMAVVASVALDLLTRSETFKSIVEVLNGILGTVADALGTLLGPLVPLLGAIGMLITAFMPLVEVVANLVAQVLEPLAPLFVALATVAQGLMPVLVVLTQLFIAVTSPLLALAGPALGTLFSVFKAVGVVVLNIAKALGDAWNWVLGGIQSVLNGLSKIPVVGGIAKRAAEGLESLKVDTDAMAKALMELQGLSYEAAKAKAVEAAESFRNAEANKKATEALSNVPSGWKRALRTFEAQSGQAPPWTPTVSSGGWGSPVPTGGSMGTPWESGTAAPPRGPPPAGVPGGQGVAVGERPTQTVNIIGYDIDEAVREGVKAGVLADGAASQRGAGRTGGRAMSYETP